MKRPAEGLLQTSRDLTTPAMVFDLDLLDDSVGRARRVSQGAGCRLLYSIKACAHRTVLQRLLPAIDGFSCSSAFEACWAREIAQSTHSVHATAPGLRPSDLASLETVADYLSFNTLSQQRRAGGAETTRARLGLRINPGFSVVPDERYDPCRKDSKLGTLPEELEASLSPDGKLPGGITGLLIHTNCDSSDFGQLLETVRRLDQRLGPVLDQVAWINLGGGYLFDDPAAVDDLASCIEILSQGRQVEVFMEPGAGIVDDCGYLVTSVVDLLVRDGRSIAVLDTTINHLPEVFEFGLETAVVDAIEGVGHAYILAGASCLAGDLFGTYTFAAPLEIGQRLVLAKVGAYTTAKAHMFNGICLPELYTHSSDTGLELEYRADYTDYLRSLGITSDFTERGRP